MHKFFLFQEISSDFQIKDVNENFVKAGSVYTKMIYKLKARLEEEIQTEYKDIEYNPKKIQWILTIPVTLIDHTEKFLRTCAKAVIPLLNTIWLI